MYGIVNQAIQGLVVENYGQEKWNEILQLSGVQETQFISNESYEDEITFELVAAASETLQLRQEDVLFAFGEYWILNTGHQKYGELMKAGGKDFLEFMKNLPNFHGRIMLIYPKLCPPEFLVEVEHEKKIILHYYSARSGLTHFVFGLIHGIAAMFHQTIKMELLSSEPGATWHDTFLIELID